MPTRHRLADAPGPAKPGALLVIGVHREELAFGERVAALLAERDALHDLEVLRIPEGISGRHPRADQRFHYEIAHRAIYRQINDLAGGRRLLIDLHVGADDRGHCADLISADLGLIGCLRARIAAEAEAGTRVRVLQLTEAGEAAPKGSPAARTVIPENVWRGADYAFVAIEVYLASGREGGEADWRLAADLIAQVRECAARAGET